MADVKVRNLEDWVVNAFKARAVLHGRSLEEELRETLREGASRPTAEEMQKRRALADQYRLRLEKLREQHGDFSDSAEEIRAEREENGW